MPKIAKKRLEISIAPGSGIGTAWVDVVYNVNSSGDFYCAIPESLQSYFGKGQVYKECVKVATNRAGAPTVFAKTLEALESELYAALRKVNVPDVTVEHVIRYNIKSSVNFAQDGNGGIYPNATFEGAEWPEFNSGDHRMYGGHYATNRAKGGYSLCIGGEALTKKTYRVGSKVSVQYEKYSGPDSKAAELLNSWVGFELPKDAKEIPYTEEAAMFFHNLMLGMARISKQIQEATFDQSNLIALIESKAPLFLNPPASK